MLRLSKLTDYGTVIMTHLARNPGRIYSAAELAAAIGVSVPTASKILKTLARHHLLRSLRGANGGYLLARPPEQISIESRVEQLLARLSETEACGFEDLFADVQTRSGIVVTFLALLEMIRLKLVRAYQQGACGPIRVYKRAKVEGARFEQARAD